VPRPWPTVAAATPPYISFRTVHRLTDPRARDSSPLSGERVPDGGLYRLVQTGGGGVRGLAVAVASEDLSQVVESGSSTLRGG
jgi:hypothetical protein